MIRWDGNQQSQVFYVLATYINVVGLELITDIVYTIAINYTSTLEYSLIIMNIADN